MLGDSLDEGLTDALGEIEGETLALGDPLLLGLREGDSELLGDALALGEIDGDSLLEGDAELDGETLSDTLPLGERLGLGLVLADGDELGEVVNANAKCASADDPDPSVLPNTTLRIPEVIEHVTATLLSGHAAAVHVVPSESANSPTSVLIGPRASRTTVSSRILMNEVRAEPALPIARLME